MTFCLGSYGEAMVMSIVTMTVIIKTVIIRTVIIRTIIKIVNKAHGSYSMNKDLKRWFYIQVLRSTSEALRINNSA